MQWRQWIHNVGLAMCLGLALSGCGSGDEGDDGTAGTELPAAEEDQLVTTQQVVITIDRCQSCAQNAQAAAEAAAQAAREAAKAAEARARRLRQVEEARINQCVKTRDEALRVCDAQASRAGTAIGSAEGMCLAQARSRCAQGNSAQQLRQCGTESTIAIDLQMDDCKGKAPASASPTSRALHFRRCEAAAANLHTQVEPSCGGADNFRGFGSTRALCVAAASQPCSNAAAAERARAAGIVQQCVQKAVKDADFCMQPPNS